MTFARTSGMEKVVNRQYTVLSDRVFGDTVVWATPSRRWRHGGDIALDTTLLIDVDGRSVARVSETLPDLPKPEEILRRIAKRQAEPRRLVRNNSCMSSRCSSSRAFQQGIWATVR